MWSCPPVVRWQILKTPRELHVCAVIHEIAALFTDMQTLDSISLSFGTLKVLCMHVIYFNCTKANKLMFAEISKTLQVLILVSQKTMLWPVILL